MEHHSMEVDEGESDKDARILQQCCEDAGVPADIIERMIAAEAKVYGMGRRHGVMEALKELVDEAISRDGGASE